MCKQRKEETGWPTHEPLVRGLAVFLVRRIEQAFLFQLNAENTNNETIRLGHTLIDQKEYTCILNRYLSFSCSANKSRMGGGNEGGGETTGTDKREAALPAIT